MIDREAIYAALFERLSAIPGLKTTSRRLRHWTDVGSSEQPALFQAQRNQLAKTTPGTPSVWTLFADIYIYVSNTGDTPAAGMNALINAVEAALAPDNRVKNTCTLGGLCSFCFIDGSVETDEGTLGNQAVAIVPIKIVAA